MTQPHTTQSLHFTPHWPLAIVALLLLPVLTGLGLWQLDRAEQKRAIETTYRERQAAAPVELGTTSVDSLPIYTQVVARGELDNRHLWYLDNRQRDGRPGYEIVQPFVLDDGARVLVNRGWVPAPPTRESLPGVAPITGPVTLFGQVAVAGQHPLLSAKGSEGWPKLITQVVPATMSEALGQPLASRYLKLDAASTGALRTGWRVVNMSASRHTGYAIQWFAMALALMVLSVFAQTNLTDYWRSRRRKTVQENE